jgi:hypothetical protein
MLTKMPVPTIEPSPISTAPGTPTTLASRPPLTGAGHAALRAKLGLRSCTHRPRELLAFVSLSPASPEPGWTIREGRSRYVCAGCGRSERPENIVRCRAGKLRLSSGWSFVRRIRMTSWRRHCANT